MTTFDLPGHLRRPNLRQEGGRMAKIKENLFQKLMFFPKIAHLTLGENINF